MCVVDFCMFLITLSDIIDSVVIRPDIVDSEGVAISWDGFRFMN